MRVNDFDFIHVSQKLKRWWLYSNLKIDSAGVYVFSKLWNHSVLQKCENKAQCAKAHVVNKVCMVMDAFIVQKQKRETKVFLAMLCPCTMYILQGVSHKRRPLIIGDPLPLHVFFFSQLVCAISCFFGFPFPSLCKWRRLWMTPSRSKHFLHLPHDLYWDFTQTDEWAGHIFYHICLAFTSFHYIYRVSYWVYHLIY